VPANNTSKGKNAVGVVLSGTEAVAENQTIHVGFSLRAADGASVSLSYSIGYVDAAGHGNWVSRTIVAKGTVGWQRVDGSLVMPSGMRVSGFFVHQDAGSAACEVTNPTLSYGSPVTLASSAHTPYATQDHLQTNYATNSALKQTSNLLDQTSNVANDAKSTADTASTKADTAKNTADTISGDLTSFIKAMNKTVDGLQSQIDGSIQTWFYEIPPTNENVPAKDWTTTDLKNNHLGDLYYDTKTGYCYRYQVENNTYSWQRVTDVDVTKALSDAAKAQDTADHKRRVFTITPTPPYDIGDLWTDGKDLRRCNTEKTSEQSYISTDWELATTYTDDTVANKALNQAKLTDQHFWTDDSGAHISTGAEKDTSGAHVDINSELQAFKIGDTVYAGYGKDGEFCYDENGVIYNQAGLFSGGKINDEPHIYANPVVLDHVCGDIKSISGYNTVINYPITPTSLSKDGKTLNFTGSGNIGTIYVSYITTDKMPYFTRGSRKIDSEIGINSSVNGKLNVASGYVSNAEGSHTTAIGYASHAEGVGTTASGPYSHSEGYYTTASGPYSHSEGYYTTASFNDSHAEGYSTTSSSYVSHAEGSNTTASGPYSHAQNYYTIAEGISQTALGKFNVKDAANKHAVIIGNGTSDTARSNALAVNWDGGLTLSDGTDVSADNLHYVLTAPRVFAGSTVIQAAGSMWNPLFTTDEMKTNFGCTENPQYHSSVQASNADNNAQGVVIVGCYWSVSEKRWDYKTDTATHVGPIRINYIVVVW
jgi:hypothetical protein